MDSESEWMYDRMRLYKLMVAYPGLSSLRLAEAVGRSARWVRKWVARFKAAEHADMRLFASQSRAPKRRPRQVGEVVKDAICQLRQALSEQYHRPAGAMLIRAYLLQDEVVKALDGFVPRSSRTITRILRERGYIRTRPTPTHMPLALCAPMDEWEMDFCEVHLADGRFEFFLVVDRGTSRVVYVEGSEGYRGESALMAVYRLFEHSGLPKRLRFDRDPRFVWSWSADSYPAPLVYAFLTSAPGAVSGHRDPGLDCCETGASQGKRRWTRHIMRTGPCCDSGCGNDLEKASGST